jgi:hypothetical protein
MSFRLRSWLAPIRSVGFTYKGSRAFTLYERTGSAEALEAMLDAARRAQAATRWMTATAPGVPPIWRPRL